ncbi:MAG: KilA-N domain-containing protein [Bacteroidota bacterium]
MAEIQVDGKLIQIREYGTREYISLTDMVGERSRASDIIRNWLRTAQTLDFLAAWEQMFNPHFKTVNFDGFRIQAGSPNFTLSVKEWIGETGAIGIVAKAGRYGGTYAHPDIAFEFGGRISPTFKILVIREYQALKVAEAQRVGSGWDYSRFLSKVNYHIHNRSIADHLAPRVNKSDENFLYASEADLLNLALFGMTAKQWREANPKAARKGHNLRDEASIAELTVLSNLESFNAQLIQNGASKEARLQAMLNMVQYQLPILIDLNQVDGKGGQLLE